MLLVRRSVGYEKVPAVSSAIRRPARSRALLVLLTALGMALTACGSGPSQANSAAIVGDRAVSLGDVQHDIKWVIDNVPQAKQQRKQRKLDQVSQKMVTYRVLHELVSVAAKRERISVDQAAVDQEIAAGGGVQQLAKQNQLTPGQLRQVVHDQKLMIELARKNLNRLQVSFTLGAVANDKGGSSAKEQALDLAKKMAADPDRAAQLSQRHSSPQPPQQTTGTLTSGQSVTVSGQSVMDMSRLFSVPAGHVVVFQPSQQQAGWMVALVHERNTNGKGDKAATDQLRAQLGEQNFDSLLSQLGRLQLGPLAEELGVRVNPRYGVWDQVNMAVAPSEDELVGYDVPVRDASDAKP